MNRRWSIVLVLAVGLSTVGSVCDDDDQITGTYSLTISEFEDECDNELNTFASEATIVTGPDGYIVRFGDDAALTGDFDENGDLVASGTIEDDGAGHTTFMAVRLVIKQGQITFGSNGFLRYNGTFPEVPGMCQQDFTIFGDRNDNVTPVLG